MYIISLLLSFGLQFKDINLCMHSKPHGNIQLSNWYNMMTVFDILVAFYLHMG
jgi:hypothetical protein